MKERGLREEVGVLVDVSAALATRDSRTIRSALEAAGDGRADPAAIEEVLLQSYLFLGYPAALMALGAWRELGHPVCAEAVADDWDLWMTRGASVCEAVYKGQYERLRDNVRALHPDLERWMVAEGYGKVLGSERLALPVRELTVAALLAVLGAEAQLYSHLRGALNVGASTAEVEAMLDRVRRFTDEGAERIARDTWNRVRSRNEGLDRTGGGGV